MSIEGVDYSSTANADWAGLNAALKARGKFFKGRYVVSDHSPAGRGYTAAERVADNADNMDVFVYYEGPANWMLGGFNAGVSAAQGAQANILAAGLPGLIPVYFACDIDATPEQQAVIDDCLHGAASVIGPGRTGVYGGFYVVSRCAANNSAKWFAQTSAWSGGQWFSGNHLEQYAYNDIIAGTNCDDVRALQANFGQASKFTAQPATTPAPKPVPTTPAPQPKPVVAYPEGMDAGVASRIFGSVKASNGVTVKYAEGDELSDLWRQSGHYGRLIDVLVTNDQPTRIYWTFSSGDVYWRPNPNAPIRLMKAA